MLKFNEAKKIFGELDMMFGAGGVKRLRASVWWRRIDVKMQIHATSVA